MLDEFPKDELLPEPPPAPAPVKPQTFAVVVEEVLDVTHVRGYLESNGLPVTAKVSVDEGKRLIGEFAKAKPGIAGAGKKPPTVAVTLDDITSIASSPKPAPKAKK